MKSDFGIYSGNEFLDLELKTRDFLVDNIMREKDSVIVLGNEKAGKTILSFQLAISMTSQQPFVDKFNVSKRCRVCYVQLEGELADSQDRFKRMMEAIEFDPTHFTMLFYPPINLEDDKVADKLAEELEPYEPDVVIIDPIYFAMVGSLSDDGPVRKFTGNIRRIKDSLDCAVVLVHHTHKIRLKPTGEPIMEGDEAIFGSKFLKAWPDHILMLSHNKTTGIRRLTCGTQRSGDIMETVTLNLHGPIPLYFEEIDAKNIDKEKHRTLATMLTSDLYGHGATVEDMEKVLGCSRRTVYIALKHLAKEYKLDKTKTRPVVYTLLGEREPPRYDN